MVMSIVTSVLAFVTLLVWYMGTDWGYRAALFVGALAALSLIFYIVSLCLAVLIGAYLDR